MQKVKLIKSSKHAFTIVELLIVIVIIGILAAITIVGYSGITNRANQSSLQSDLSIAKKQFELYKVDHGEYPTGLNGDNCPTGNTLPNPDMKYCIKNSGGNSFTFTSGGGVTYELKAIKGELAYKITESSAPIITSVTPPVTGWKQVTNGLMHTCAVSPSDKVYCWGYNNSGPSSKIPVAIDTSGVLNGKTIKSISAGWYHTCAIASDNQAYCWGGNPYGQLGDNTTVEKLNPVGINMAGALNGKTIKEISSGGNYTCVIASDDKVYCWGLNGNGQLGNNSNTQSNVPVAIDMTGALNGKTIKSLSNGNAHTCVIASDNQGYCWGFGGYGEIGNNSTNSPLTPTAVTTSGSLSGKTLISISSGQYHTCAIASDNQAYCWGGNTYGQLGNNTTTQNLTPTPIYTSGILNGKTIKTISASYGDDFSCLVASDNQAYCWGHNSYGNIGNNSTIDSPIPIAVSATGVLNSKQISGISTSRHVCAKSSDGQIYCWGSNLVGQLGNNSATDSPIPVTAQLP